MSHHGAHAEWNVELILTFPFLFAAALYAGAAWLQSRRGRPWPWYRTLAWMGGVVLAATGFLGPLAAAAHQDFVAHTAVHLLLGMAAPLLLILGAPVTLALRSMHVTPARRLARLLSSPPARLATVPLVAAVLSVGGMWLLYRTPLYAAVQQDPMAHVLMGVHFLVAGCLFTVAVIPVDPAPHRAAFPMRMGVLIASLAAHSILAKLIYAQPPAGVDAADGQSAAQLMYYAGGLWEAVVLTILCAAWYRAAGRRLDRPARVAEVPVE